MVRPSCLIPNINPQIEKEYLTILASLKISLIPNTSSEGKKRTFSKQVKGSQLGQPKQHQKLSILYCCIGAKSKDGSSTKQGCQNKASLGTLSLLGLGKEGRSQT